MATGVRQVPSRIRGVRQSIPSGFVLGNTSGAQGGQPAQLVSVADIARSASAAQGGRPPEPGYTVATLPAGVIGMRAYVTDATAPTFLAIVAGSGAVKTPVFFNGTHWVCG